jgi:hypothetical protein
MAGAHDKARELLVYPKDERFAESIRQFQG